MSRNEIEFEMYVRVRLGLGESNQMANSGSHKRRQNN